MILEQKDIQSNTLMFSQVDTEAYMYEQNQKLTS